MKEIYLAPVNMTEKAWGFYCESSYRIFKTIEDEPHYIIGLTKDDIIDEYETIESVYEFFENELDTF